MIFFLAEVQDKIGYSFKDSEIIRTAFTHPSFSNEKLGEINYERLEFLGDSVLGFIVADYLFKGSDKNEGQMTKSKSDIVSSFPLSSATKKLGLDKYLLISPGMIVTDNIRENLFESVVGAIYLDGGISEATKFVKKNLIDFVAKNKVVIEKNNYKSQINELATKRRLGIVKYLFKDKTGGDHNPTFTMQLTINGEVVAEGKGASKKSAEQQAAKKALQKLVKAVKK